LIHYHFGGLPGLHEAIARRAGDEIVGSVVDVLVEAPDAAAALEAVRALVPATTADGQRMRLAVEVMAGSLRDPVLGEVLRQELRRARERIGARLAELHPSWSPERRAGAATVIVALVDGLLLHRLLDTALPLDEALTALGDLLAARA
jgi:hypothetical protein